MTAKKKPNKARWLLVARYLLFALALLMAFLAGGSVGFWYIHNKQMSVNCNFLVAPGQLPFRT